LEVQPFSLGGVAHPFFPKFVTITFASIVILAYAKLSTTTITSSSTSNLSIGFGLV